MPRYRDIATGRIIERDENGQEVKRAKSETISSTKDRGSLMPSGTYEGKPIGATIRAETAADRFFNIPIIGGKDLPSTLTGIGGAIGTPLPYVGNLAGAFGGAQLGKALQYMAPNWFGKNTDESISDNLIDTVSSAVLDRGVSKASGVLGGMIPSNAKQHVQKLVRSAFGPSIRQETVQALKSDPGFDVSVGQTNNLAKVIENTFAGKAKNEMVKGQESKILDKVTRELSADPEKVLERAKGLAKTNVSEMRGVSKKLYADLKPEIEANTQVLHEVIPGNPGTQTKNPFTGQVETKGATAAGTKEVSIKGAVATNNSTPFVEETNKMIGAIMGEADTNLAHIDAASGGYLRTLRTELNKIASIKTYVDPKTGQATAPMAEYDQLKIVRDSLNDFVAGSRDQVLKGKLMGPLTTLEKSINADMEAGVKNWGEKAYTKHRMAQASWQNLAQKVNPKMAEDLLKVGKDPETTYKMVARDALSDPMKARQFKAVTNDQETLKELFNNDLLQNSMDTANNRFDPKKAMTYLHNNKGVADEALDMPARRSFEEFLQRADLVGPHTESANVGLKLRLGTGAIGLAVGGASMFATGDKSNSALLGGSIILGSVGMNQFAKRVLMNPKMARIATRQLEVDPKTTVGKVGAAAILTAMKGMQVKFMSRNNEQLDAQIDENGKIRIIGKSEPEE